MKKFTSQEIQYFVSMPQFDERILREKNPSFPRITVITPSYNQASFIERTILSILNQNYPNIEYIIIDGRSTDGTVEIIKKYERFLAYWESEADKGQADAIARGIKMSTGEILAWLNSDDIYLPGAIFAVAEEFRKDSSLDLVYGNGYRVSTEDKILGDARYTSFHFPTLLHSSAMMQAASFWRRAAYNRAGGINEMYQFCMDYDFLLRVTRSGKAKHFRQYLSCFRVHDNQKTNIIAHIGKKEHAVIRDNFINTDPCRIWKYRSFWRPYCLIRRAFLYLVQGDSDYFFKGIYRRISGKKYQKTKE